MLYDDKNIFPLMKMWKWLKKIQKYFLLGLLHSTHLPSILASWQEGFHHYCHCTCEHVLLSIIPNHFLFVYLDKQNHTLVEFFPRNIFSSCPNHFHCIITVLSSPSMSSMQSTMSLSSSSIVPTSPMWTPKGKRAIRRRHGKTLGNYFQIFLQKYQKYSLSSEKMTWGNPWTIGFLLNIWYSVWHEKERLANLWVEVLIFHLSYFIFDTNHTLLIAYSQYPTIPNIKYLKYSKYPTIQNINLFLQRKYTITFFFSCLSVFL